MGDYFNTKPGHAYTNEQMVREQVEARGIRNMRVLEAMLRVDRSLFVPPDLKKETYSDCALPVGYEQTISQPYIVGLMTELLDPQPTDRILEIGAGTGYQTAILLELGAEVWSLEIVHELADATRNWLKALGYRNSNVVEGNGWEGLPEHAPYQKILVAAAPEKVPEKLLTQLAIGGRIIVPIGIGDQDLIVIERTGESQFDRKSIAPVRFVPLVGGGS